MKTFDTLKSLLLVCILIDTLLVSSKQLSLKNPIENFVKGQNSSEDNFPEDRIHLSNQSQSRSKAEKSYHYENTEASGGSYFKLINNHVFDITEDILGRSLHIDSTEHLANQNSDEVVIVESPRYEDLDEFDVFAQEIEDDDEEEGVEQSLGDYSYTRHLSELDDTSYRQFSWGDNSNTSSQEKISNSYFKTMIEDQTHLLEKINTNHLNRYKPRPQPLFLTPYIYSGNYKEGQKLAAVKPFVGNIKSYSGYLTVDKRFHSNTFFWFFPSERPDYQKRPVLLWLQGGPGGSSLFGLFFENGPYKIVNDRIYRNEDSWTKQYNVLYIDNPVGTGFSFTTPQGYTRNQTIIGKHVYEALKQFFHLFPDLADNDFYITGESYAGKYIPAAAYEIHTRNLLSHFKINLKGLFIGNGLVDPISMMEYSDYLFHIGLLDEYQRDLFAKEEKKIKLAIRTKQWKRASDVFENLFFGSRENKTKGPNFRRITGFRQHYNLNGLDFNTADFNHFIRDEKVRERLHVGHMKFNSGAEVGEALLRDIMKSVIDKVSILVENYRVVLYYGQLDIICPYRLSEAFFHNIQFRHAYDYYKAERQIWTYERQDDQDNVVGFIKEAHNLVEVLIRNAGHMVPRDQPRFMMDLLKKYIGS